MISEEVTKKNIIFMLFKIWSYLLSTLFCKLRSKEPEFKI